MSIAIIIVISGVFIIRSPGIKNIGNKSTLIPTASPIQQKASATKTPTVIPTPILTTAKDLGYTISFPDSWTYYDNGIIRIGDSKIGTIVGIIRWATTCNSYWDSQIKLEEDSNSRRTKLIDSWTEDIASRTWYVNYASVVCLGGCVWNYYCTEGENEIFSMYISHDYVVENESTIKQMLSSFKFNSL